MKKYVIKLNGKVYEVEMEEVTGEAAATAKGSNSAPAVNKAPQTATAQAPVAQASGGETVEAPMPGNIVGVLVKVGDQVKKDQVLVVLEAMKMENEIVSPIDGKVLSVGVTKGQTVNPGEVLVQIG
ncbi:biotin/lipoyl-containing protein [Desnuesiella massiliensis]|uniref:biotin/lipoyl-containing protein n=1 Tax=Desnuesiella massiliensis TaxID=1650662 RepID=UPI0006E2AE37|nr:biotin/lipoyl-containing protein [Desnuesiella massiliensis]